MRSLQKTALTTFGLLLSCYVLADAPTPPASVPPSAPKTRCKAGYNAPADVRVNRSWDAYITGNFVYWEALQDNMELGVVSIPSNSQISVDGYIVNNKVEYKPGFQVALGFGSSYDGWNTELKYTWFYSKTHTSASIDPTSPLVLWPMWLTPQGITFQSGSETWKLSLNTLDWVLGRTSQIGKRLNLRPFFGLRGAWISEKAHINYYNATPPIPSQNLYATTQYKSWGVGPEIGLSSRWLLGKGFKLYGDIEADILYTRYTSLNSKEEKQFSGGPILLRRDVSQHNLSLLRPHCDMEVGIAWGSYFRKKAIHLDLSLGYGFQVFWSQNMFRKFTDYLEKGASQAPNGDLYLQGLTASVRLDF